MNWIKTHSACCTFATRLQLLNGAPLPPAPVYVAGTFSYDIDIQGGDPQAWTANPPSGSLSAVPPGAACCCRVTTPFAVLTISLSRQSSSAGWHTMRLDGDRHAGCKSNQTCNLD